MTIQNNICQVIKFYFNFRSNQGSFFIFCFTLCKVVDHKYRSGDSKTLKVNIGTIIKDRKILRFESS